MSGKEAYSIGGWPSTKGRPRNGGGTGKAKALLRRMDAAAGSRQNGTTKSGIAGRRGRSNFLFAVLAKNLIKKLGL